MRERKGKLLTMYVPGQEKKFQEIPLKSFDASDFNPHGLSLFTDPATGDISVFVINHKSNGSQVIEIFDFEPKSHSLVHRRSVVDPRINSPNDVLAVGEGRRVFRLVACPQALRFVLGESGTRKTGANYKKTRGRGKEVGWRNGAPPPSPRVFL